MLFTLTIRLLLNEMIEEEPMQCVTLLMQLRCIAALLDLLYDLLLRQNWVETGVQTKLDAPLESPDLGPEAVHSLIAHLLHFKVMLVINLELPAEALNTFPVVWLPGLLLPSLSPDAFLYLRRDEVHTSSLHNGIMRELIMELVLQQDPVKQCLTHTLVMEEFCIHLILFVTRVNAIIACGRHPWKGELRNIELVEHCLVIIFGAQILLKEVVRLPAVDAI